MQVHRWFNQSQPRNLQNAVILLYLNAVFALLFGLLSGGVYAGINVLTIAGVAGGYGIANDKKWGYYAALAVAGLALLGSLALLLAGHLYVLNLPLVFQVILVILLTQKSTREYIRIWFK